MNDLDLIKLLNSNDQTIRELANSLINERGGYWFEATEQGTKINIGKMPNLKIENPKKEIKTNNNLNPSKEEYYSNISRIHGPFLALYLGHQNYLNPSYIVIEE